MSIPPELSDIFFNSGPVEAAFNRYATNEAKGANKDGFDVDAEQTCNAALIEAARDLIRNLYALGIPGTFKAEELANDAWARL